MALIDKKLVVPRETASYKLDCQTVELVRFYSEFIGSPQEHVVNEALLFIFRKDKDFNEWLRNQGKADLTHSDPSPNKAIGVKASPAAKVPSKSTGIYLAKSAYFAQRIC